MGYILNELANLPVDDNVHMYIFVINGQFREPLYDLIESNLFEIAKSIGNNAVIAIGTERKMFTTSVAKKYLGKGNSAPEFAYLLPALLITNAHPEKLTPQSMRLVVPLRDAENRFGGWAPFFQLLGEFVRNESDEFLRRFEAKENFLQAANELVGLKPGMFGISININEMVDRYLKGPKKAAG